jgi:hypothetical protein
MPEHILFRVYYNDHMQETPKEPIDNRPMRPCKVSLQSYNRLLLKLSKSMELMLAQ